MQAVPAGVSPDSGDGAGGLRRADAYPSLRRARASSEREETPSFS